MPTTRTHDITIEDASAGTPKVGLMLARQNGQRRFGIKDYETIAPRLLTTQELDAAQLPPQVELTWFQEDWRAGLGGRNHRLDPKKYALGYKIDATVEGQIQLARDLIVTTDDAAPTAYKPSGFAISGTGVWSFQERDVYLLTYATNQWVKKTQPQNVAVVYRNGVNFNGNTYVPAWLVADETAGTYIYKADANAQWTLSTVATGKTFKYFCRGRTAAGTEVLIGGNAGSTNKHKIYSSSDPTNTGSWSLLATIGGSDSEITGLISDGATVLVLKTNGIWAYYADGGVENITPEFESMADPDNFRGAFNWNGHMLLPLGSGGMSELSGGKLYDVSLKNYAPDQTTLQGRVLAITGDTTNLFVLVLDTTNTKYHLLMATWDEFQGKQDFCWHHVGAVTYTTSTVANHAALFAEGIPSGTTLHHRIWVGIESGGSNSVPSFYPLPDPNDANLVFTNDDDGYLNTVAWDANLAKVNKLYNSIDFTTLNLDDGANDHYIEVKYRLNGTGSWSYITGVQATSTLNYSDGVQTLTFGDEVVAKKLELQFLFFQGTTTTTSPILKDFTVRAALRPTAILSYPIQAYLADNQMLLNGARGGKPKVDLAQLKAWNTGAAEVTLTLPDASTQDVVFLPGMMTVQELAVVHLRRTEYLVTFLLGAV